MMLFEVWFATRGSMPVYRNASNRLDDLRCLNCRVLARCDMLYGRGDIDVVIVVKGLLDTQLTSCRLQQPMKGTPLDTSRSIISNRNR